MSFPNVVVHMERSKDLVEHNLDNHVTAREKALELILNRIRKTVAVMEPMVEKLQGKPKPKSVNTIGNQEECVPVEPRPERTVYYHSILSRVSNGDVAAVIENDTHVPPLPP